MSKFTFVVLFIMLVFVLMGGIDRVGHLGSNDGGGVGEWKILKVNSGKSVVLRYCISNPFVNMGTAF